MQRKRWTSRFAPIGLVVAATVAAACGEVSTKKPDGGDIIAPPGDFALSVDQSAVTIAIASETTVMVSVAPNGDVGDVTMTAEGLGSNLEVTFAPNPVVTPTTGAVTTIATIRAKGGTTAGTSTVTLTGTAGDKTHSVTVEVTTSTITVSGTVRGGRSGITVGMIGKPSVTSGAGGVFTFTDVTPPYDLYTVIDTGCGTSLASATKSVFYYDGLTRPDPVVTADTAFVMVAQASYCLAIGILYCADCSAPTTSARSVGGTGNGTDRVVGQWGAPGGSFTVGSVSASTITGTAEWFSGTNSTSNLYLIQFTRKTTEAPDTYLGFAKSAQTTITKSTGPAQSIPVTFVAVGSTATLTGTLNQPPGYPAAQIKLRQEFGSVSTELWSTTATNTVDATIPLIPAAGGTNLYAYSAMGSANSAYVYPLSQNTTINFTMPTAAVQLAPDPGATGVTTATSFMWTPSTNALSEVTMSGGGRFYKIYTTASQLTPPVIPEATFPGGASMSWAVGGYGPNSSGVNDAAAQNELEQVSAADFQGPAHFYTYSGSRSFTTP